MKETCSSYRPLSLQSISYIGIYTRIIYTVFFDAITLWECEIQYGECGHLRHAGHYPPNWTLSPIARIN